MPKNSNARREKGKKRKDEKKRTDSTPLHKEDKASVDSSSLSLAAKDKASVDSSSFLFLAGIREVPEIENLERDALKAQAKKRQVEKDSPLLSLSSEEMEKQDLSFALDKMEKVIQENANAVHEKDAGWSWAMSALLVEHHRATTMDDRTAMRRKIREEIRKANPLVSREELKSYLDKAMVRAALEWRKNDLQSRKDSLSLLP
jgi:hypothetical protein